MKKNSKDLALHYNWLPEGFMFFCEDQFSRIDFPGWGVRMVNQDNQILFNVFLRHNTLILDTFLILLNFCSVFGEK